MLILLAILVFALLLLLVVFAYTTSVTIRRLTTAVRAFIENSERAPLVVPGLASGNVKNLSRAFVELLGKVDSMHTRDIEISRVKSDFITTAAHQLRTPLTGIRWALEALEKGDLTEEQRALIKNASEKSHELVSIVGTLLDISAIESGKYNYRFEPVDVRSVMAEVIRDFQGIAGEQKVSFIMKEPLQLPAIRADRERVKWVLTNLVENAINYTPQQGSVMLGASQGPGRVLITVRDTGIGIPSRDSTNIFERFYRAPNAIAKESHGNGLGLYIARTIATDHGGDLNFRGNLEGPGTTFTLSLPVAGPNS